jgi:hypothetical protein
MSGDKELDAMATIAGSLAKLDEPEIARVVRWAADKFKVELGVGRVRAAEAPLANSDGEFEDLATLFDAVRPKTDAEKALTCGFWFQVVKGQKDLEAQPLNAELKNLGHGLGNITDAMTSLTSRSPSLLIQTQKSGTSRQARKRYRLTTAGIDFIRRRLADEGLQNGHH